MTNPGGKDERNGAAGGPSRPGGPTPPVPPRPSTPQAAETTQFPLVPPSGADAPNQGAPSQGAPSQGATPPAPGAGRPADPGAPRTAYQPLSGRPVDNDELAAEADRGAGAPGEKPETPAEEPVVIRKSPAAPAAGGDGPGGDGPGGDGPGGDGPGGDGPGGDGPDEPDDGDHDDSHKKGLREIVSGSLLRRVVTGGVAGVALIMVVALLAFLVGYWRTDVPLPGEIPTTQVANIVMKDGQTPVARVVPDEGNREILPAQDIPDVMKNAIMAAEDREFATNPGFSVKGFARAVWKRVPGVAGDGEDAGGGSTITQQYVKNALVGDESSLTRKWKELIMSTKMSNSWSKDDIMAAYLNTIYFGRGAYGIQAASKAYFNVNAKDLKVEQAALLAGLVRGPSLYEPTTHLADATGRWNYVLDGMVEMKTVDPAQRAKMQFPKTIPQGRANGDDLSLGPNGLIKTQVLRELKDAGIDELTLSTQGLKVTTTIDPAAQAAAVKAAKNMAENQPNDLRTAVVSVDPKTGGVLAYYGGDDGNGYDRVQAGLQTGSSFKVFALVAALEQGIPLSRVYSSSPFKAQGVTVTNSEGESCGSCNLATAMKMSLNTVFYRLMMDLNNQAQDVADAAHKAGVAESFGGIKKTLEQADGSGVEGGVVLGQYQSRPLDMASAYATLAAEGVYRAPHLITKVTTADGRTLLDRQTDPGQRRFSKDVANNVTAALQPIAAYSNGHGLAGGRASAAKTGTAQYQDTGQNKDAWMVGYTPSISTAVWVGNDKGGPITNSWGGSIYGSGVPSDVWKQTMDGALEDTDYESFPTPGAIGGQAGVPVETRTRTSSTGTASASASAGESGSATRTVPGLPGVPMPTFPWDPTTTQPGNPNVPGQTTVRPRPGTGGTVPGNGGRTVPPRVTNPVP
ncbi:penicillin-binding protein [Tsukamurella pulmonis]|uniref:Peptidoglycan glycosyltransferase n=1 Tax=Tsukamurella pulmonis TaxID=47312 RepID=A0A1H1AMJ2_9ACTN|nr:transglycosylase domain-containing protein [Tsukamurella pulmonis]KXO96049.1 penicillin-binding protein [Tsukamurella pulmonis]SDQ40844.1 peptidoglycan glycosyltransferase [Tsukamurella pulmonis]SUP26406.1 Penicillin-binding protein 4 precursor [Tsukamurella pulmonis]